MSDATTPPRRRWPWIVAAGVVALLIAGVVYAVTTLGGVYARGPIQAVEAFHTAIEDVDCGSFQAVTSETVRAASFSTTGIFSCDDWATIAESFTVDGVYEYSATLVSSEVDGTHALVYMDETDASKDPAARFAVAYQVDLVDGEWIITGYLVTAIEE
jgi:hypothetical protein